MEVSVQLHVSATLPPEIVPLVPIEEEVGYAPLALRVFWRREIFFFLRLCFRAS